MSQLKIKNGNNWESIPAGGIGVPSGGTTGQVLQKSSNTDYATEWASPTIETGTITRVFTASGTFEQMQCYRIGNTACVGARIYDMTSSSATGMNTVYFNVPDGFRPPIDIYIPCAIQLSSNSTFVSTFGILKTNGDFVPAYGSAQIKQISLLAAYALE